MKKYILNRIFNTTIVILGVSLVTFILINVVPGDPISLMLGQKLGPESIQRIKHEFGTDRPLYIQYIDFLLKLLRLDFGYSYFTGQKVSDVISSSFLTTIKLTLLSFTISVIIGITIGIMAAVNRGKLVDSALMSIVIVFMSAPSFWIALILQIIFGLKLNLLPISGIHGYKSYILPCISIGLRYAAVSARFTRTAMLDVIGKPYITTARAKGQTEFIVIVYHTLKNALIPIITLLGMQLGGLLTGSMLIETVFSIPGIGKLTIDSMMSRDLPVLQGCMLYIAFIFAITNLIVDILYSIADPRIRTKE